MGNKYGYGCANECECFKDGTAECNKESGDCKCKDKYFGLNCEFSCFNGNLICLNSNSTIDCKCELTIDQQLEIVKKSKNNFIIALIILVLISLTILIGLIKYKIKSRKLKKVIKEMTIQFSTLSNQHEKNLLI